MFPSLLESVAPIFYDTVKLTADWDWLESGSVQAGRSIGCLHRLSQKEKNVHLNCVQREGALQHS